jgi:hypothetical protein
MTSLLLHQLIGTWFIVSTDFPMWLKGDKLSPSFTYTLTEHRGEQLLYDEVKYLKNGKTKTIKGYDRQDKTDSTCFKWRGNGLLFIASSNWQVKLIDKEGQWAVIWFSKTLFTPEGVDIISREKELSPEIIKEIKNKMSEDELLKKHTGRLVQLK